jgi:hypothetical protein
MDSVVAMNSDVKFHAPIGRSFPPSPRSTPPSTRDTPRTTAQGRVVAHSRQQPKAADLSVDRGGEVMVAPMSPSGWRGGRGSRFYSALAESDRVKHNRDNLGENPAWFVGVHPNPELGEDSGKWGLPGGDREQARVAWVSDARGEESG